MVINNISKLLTVKLLTIVVDNRNNRFNQIKPFFLITFVVMKQPNQVQGYKVDKSTLIKFRKRKNTTSSN